jgi:hypothetical protein
MYYTPDNGGGSTPSSEPFTPYVTAGRGTYGTYDDVSPRQLTLSPSPSPYDASPSIPGDEHTVSASGPDGTSGSTSGGGATGQGSGGTTATGNFGAVLELFRNMFSGSPNTAALAQQTGTPVLVQNGSSPMNGKTILILVVIAGAAWYAHRRGVI